MSLTIVTTQIDRVGKVFDDLVKKGISDRLDGTFRKIGLVIRGESIERAPISPTKTQYEATLQDFTTLRDDFNPGGLERSIMSHHGNDFAEIFVAKNAEAGEYAEKIHDQKGKLWLNRGPGTEAKGESSDHKFIQRAIDENEDGIEEMLVVGIENVINKALGI